MKADDACKMRKGNSMKESKGNVRKQKQYDK